MKKLSLFLVAGVLSLNLAACTKTVVDEDPQTVINNAWEKLADKNADYSMGTVAIEGNGNINFEGSSGSLEGSVEVQFDSSDEENPKTAMKINLDGDGNFEGASGKVSVNGEIRTLLENTYLYLESFKLDTGDAQTSLMANFVENFFKGQWISIPNGTSSEDNKLLSPDNLNNRAIAELSKNHNFFEVKKDLGNRTYDLQINPEKLKTYLMELSKITGEELNDKDLADLDSTLEQLEYSLQVRIGNDYDLEWIKGDISANDPETNDTMNLTFEANLSKKETDGKFALKLSGETPGSLSMDFTAQHDDGKVTIEAPADAQPFDPNSLFGLGGSSLDAPSSLEGLEDLGL